jgi:hypothetical protein
MLAIVRSSKYPGGTYRDKAGVKCERFYDLAIELSRLWDLAAKEQTQETIRIEIKQEGETK